MDTVLHLQGNPASPLAPLILIHAISGLALPYFSLGPLSHEDEDLNLEAGRPVYGISSPIFGALEPRYKQCTSLKALAALYVSILRRDIRAKGPYLLGGWSMGGMIATEMAAILVSEGEVVHHIVMIDSLNPEVYLPFHDGREHHTVAALTYNSIARGMKGPEESLVPPQHDDGDISSGDVSRETSDDEDNGADSEDDDETLTTRFFRQMRDHVHYGLRLLATYRTTGSKRSRLHLPDTDVVLIKCKTLGVLSPLLRDTRRAFARQMNQDQKNGWQVDRFKSFLSLPFKATHDGCFQDGFADDLTIIMREVLRSVDV